jgi:hypothetical protein
MRIFERWYFALCWNLRLVIELLAGTYDLWTLWSPRKWVGGGVEQKKQNYQIYLVGFACVVKDIEAWLQLFTSFPAW